MILSDYTLNELMLKGDITVLTKDGTPYQFTNQIQPASIDLTLGTELRVPSDTIPTEYSSSSTTGTGFMSEINFHSIHIEEREMMQYRMTDYGYRLEPLSFILGHTAETIILPKNLGAFFCNRSGIGRLGLFTENAGFVDPAWEGRLTVELFNARKRPMRIYPGMPIGQLIVMKMDEAVQNGYGSPILASKYQNALTVQTSRLKP